MHYTLGQAAKATGISKTTISKALKSGRLSYVEKSSAGYKIDPAELDRVWPVTPLEQGKGDDRQPLKSSAADTVSDRHPSPVGGLGMVEKQAYEAQIDMLKDRVDELKEQRDKWEKQAERLSLTQQKQPVGFWSWFKKGAA